MSGLTRIHRKISTAFLAGLVVACQPPQSDQQSASGECLGDDCQENAAVHAIGGEDGIVTGEVQPASGTQSVAFNDLGPDASDGSTYPIYAQVTKIPVYKDGSVQPSDPAHYVDGNTDNSVRLDGGNFTLDADTTGTGSSLTVAFTPTDAGLGASAFEYINLNGDDNFELSYGSPNGDLIRDPSGTSTVIGTFANTADGRGQNLVVSFNASANIADIEDLILGLTYNHTGTNTGTDFTVGDRTLTVTYDDGTGTNDTDSDTVTVEVTASPTVVFSTTTGSYTEGTDLTLDSSLSLYDDAVSFSEAEIVIDAADCQSTEDVLQLSSAQTNVSDAYTTGTCTLTLTPTSGNLSLSELLSGLQAVQYSNSSDTPTTGTRTINIEVTDAAANTTTSADFDLSVAALNDAPVASVPGAQAVAENGSLTFSSGNSNLISISDSDAGTDDLELTISTTTGELTLSTTASLSFTTGDGTDDATMIFTGTATKINTALAGLVFTPDADDDTDATITVTIDDQGFGEDGSAGTPESDTETIAVTVTGSNNAPVVTVPGAQSIAEDASLTFSSGNSNLISIDDVDAGANDIEASLSVTAGELTLSTTSGLSFASGDGTDDAAMVFEGTVTEINAALAGLVFSPDADDDTDATLTVAIDDQGFSEDGSAGSALTDSDTVAITVNGSNDAPVITVPGAQTTTEDVDLTFSSGNSNLISFTDPDAGANDVEATLSVTAGSLTLSGTTGLGFTTGNGTSNTSMVFTGTVTEINNALAGMVFSPDADDETDATLSISIDDQGFSVDGSTGSAETDSETVAITVNGDNDAPVASVPGAQSVSEDGTLTFSSGNSNLISIADADAGSDDLELSISTTTGTLSLSGTATLSFTTGDGTDDAAMVFTGSATKINSALSGMSFSPDADDDTDATITVTIDDQGHSVNGSTGAAESDTETIAVTVSGDNDAPVVTVPSAQNTDEDTDLTFSSGNGNLISIDDVDAGANDIEASLSVTAGELTLSTTSGLSFASGDGTDDAAMVFEGTVAEINAALAGLVFSPDADDDTDATLTLTIDDQGFGVDGSTGSAETDTETVTITVDSVNDAPVVTVPSAQTVAEDSNLTFSSGNSNLISVADVDAGSNDVEASLSVTVGELTLSTTSGLSFSTGNGTDDASMVFEGTITEINNALAGLVFSPDADSETDATLTVTLNDQGFAEDGSAGSDETDTETVTITVTGDNDAPVITVPGAQTVAEDGSLTFSSGNSNLISFVDVDAGANDVEATLSVTTGELSLAVTTGLSFSTGDGTDDAAMVFEGTVTEINNALAGLVFSPDADDDTDATLTLTIDDQGFSVDGAASSAETDTETVAITVNGSNDDPVVTVPSAQNTDEDTDLTFSSGNGNLISVADPDAGSNDVETSISVTTGTLTLSTTSGLGFTTGNGTDDAAMVFIGTITETNAALAGLVFSPDADDLAGATLLITVDDQGHSVDGSTGSAQSDTETVAITVNSVNDAPVANTTPVLTLTTTDEDTTSTGDTIAAILASGTGDPISDVDNSPVEGMAIYATTGNGTWQYSVNNGSSFFSLSPSTTAALLLAADNTDNIIRYIPDDENGETATISFYAWDQTTGSDGSTANVSGTLGGSTAFSSTALSASIIVTDVNDDPVADVSASDTSPSVGDTVTLDATGSFDVDDGDEICAYDWVVDSGTFHDLGSPAANNPCLLSDASVDTECTNPSYVVAGTTTWSLEIWSVPTGESCSTSNSNLQISAADTVTPATSNSAPTVSAGDDLELPFDTEIALSTATATDLESADEDLVYGWTVTSYQPSSLSSFFTLTDTSTITPTMLMEADGTFSNSGRVTLTLTVTDQSGSGLSSTDTVNVYFCAGEFEDLDSDGYGDETAYFADCTTAVSSTDSLTSPVDQSSTSWNGFDCLDSGTVSDSSTTLTAAEVGETISWYLDNDGDGYGEKFEESGSSPTFSTASYPYGDTDFDGTPDDCYTVDPTTASEDYVLNGDDCNDAFTYDTEGGETLLPSQQHPNTTWYVDIDGDGYGANNSATDLYIIPNDDNDGMCYCSSDCGSLVDCSSFDSSDVETSGCDPISSLVCDVPSQLKQCMDPANTATASDPDDEYYDPSSETYLAAWMLDDGDCEEISADVNPGQTETCDPYDVDEDCNGAADDDEAFGVDINNVYKYYNDTDVDGYGEENSTESSCDGDVSLSNPLVYSYYLIDADSTDADNDYWYDTDSNCFCPDQADADCIDEEGDSCSPTGGAVSLTRVTAAAVECYCTESTCTKTCQNLAQEECSVSSTGTCTIGDFADPDWFYSFDQFDCDDDDNTVHPDAEELCDGQLNDCYFEADGTPTDEIDYDNDDFVECGYTSGWSNSNEPNVGTDCSPNDSNVYPNASNVCDGQFNNCNVWETEYTDTTGTCFCDNDTCDETTGFCVDENNDECTPDTTVTASFAYIDDAGTCFCPDAIGSDSCIDITGTVCEPDFSSSMSAASYNYVDEDSDCLCNAAGTDCKDLDGFTCTATGSTTELLDLMGCAPTGGTMSSGAPSDQVDGDDDCYVDCYDGSTTWEGGSANLGSSCSALLTGEDCDDTDATVYPGAAEVCDGQINDCDTSSLDNEELDDDGDGYVDCTYDSATWAGSGSVSGGDDCDDSYASTYPGANETCDGEHNDCDSTDYGVTDAPDDELDDDGDGFVECTYIESSWRGSGAVDGGEDCDDTSSYADFVYPGADEYCDGIFNDCEDLSYDANDPPEDESDDDGDGYVDCTQDDGESWLDTANTPTGYDDCDDDDDTVYPSADEICDGQYNDCSASGYDPDDSPTDETDNDGDGYASCGDAGSEDVDCDDDDITVYPDAEELCDGKFNDCNHPLQSDFIAAVGNCFCLSASGNTSTCVDIDDNTCTPTSENGGFMDSYVKVSIDIGGTTYKTADVEYYCPSSTCQLDVDGNDVSDCIDLNGVEGDINALDTTGDGLADNCINDLDSDPIDPNTNDSLELVRGTDLGDTAGAPTDETDDDGDDFVECEYDSDVWDNSASPYVDGGSDCDDENDLVYSGATEYCDGQYNDCSDTAYSSVSAPDDESDDDADGFVDCDVTPGIDWAGTGTPYPFYTDLGDSGIYSGETESGSCFCDSNSCSNCVDQDGAACTPVDFDANGSIDCQSLSSFIDCDDDDDAVYPGAFEACDGQYNDCNSSDFDLDDSPDDEIDDDGDGFADCPGASDTDCDDEDATRYPGAEELCDGQFNDCTHFLLDDFLGAIGTCFCQDGDGNVAGTCLSVDESGVASSCTPTSTDGITMDDFVTLNIANTISGSDHESVEADCYCPTTDCIVDSDGDNTSDCYTPDGVICPIDEIDQDDDGFADDCLEAFEPLNAGATSSANTLTIDMNLGYDLDSDSPPGETDDDGDRYVECDDYADDAWYGSPVVEGGGDCDDLSDWGKKVYVGADELCDGVFNDCSDAAYDEDGAPTDETDDDGDGYVDCSLETGIDWRLPGTDPSLAVDEDGDCFCDGADENGLCDGDCVDAFGETCSPTDSNGDSLDECTEVGGFADCDDADANTYPGAEELCDGQYNDCDNSRYSETSAPSDETDDDEDGFVDCSNEDEVLWAGAADEPDGYSDCDDDDETRFPGADELCDGVFNDCESFLLDDYAGMVGSGCYCDGYNGELDSNGDGTNDCVDSAGDTCEPIDDDADGYADYFYLTEIRIDSKTYESAVYDPDTACYCPTVDCIVDNDLNLISDCYTAAGDICSIGDIDPDDVGLADDCIVYDDGGTNVGPLDPTSGAEVTFSNPTGLDVDSDAPPDEIDDDGDRYVDCEYAESVWNEDGSALVRGGSDCDDENEWGNKVYPGADELCDGVYNDCEDSTYEADLAPTDETDDDGDGFVECFPESGESWRLESTDPNPYIDLIVDEYGLSRASDIYASSDFFYSIFMDEDADCFCPAREADETCTNEYCVDSAGTTCTPTGTCSVISGFADCDDDDDTVLPFAEQLCDGQENDCADSGVGWDGETDTWPNPDEETNGVFSNVPADERDDDGDGYVECFEGSDWATEWVGYGSASVVGDDDCDDDDSDIYPGAPEACDGVFNDCDAAMIQTYSGVVTDCYCEDEDGVIDPDGDGTADCADSSGAVCTPTDEDGDGVIDALATLVETVTIASTDYATAQATAFCFSDTCALDADNDGYEDCTDLNGDRTTPTDVDGDLLADDCAESAILDFTFGSGTLYGDYDFNNDDIIDAPLTEIDTDNDGYVECVDTGGYDGGEWKGDTSTPSTGQDCDVDDDTVYPSAAEVCDGQYNNCNTATSGAPSDETDDDEDGWVECERRDSDDSPLDWAGDIDNDGVIDTPPNVWYGDSTGCFCPSSDICADGVGASDAGCINESGLQCSPVDCTVSAGSAEINPAFAYIKDKGLLDCDDADELTFPGAAALEGFNNSNPYMAGVDPAACATDADGDLYADSASTGDCDDPATVCPGSDCDDSTDTVHPNQEESCEVGDQVDNDCNGDVNSAEGYTELEDWIAGTHPELYVDEDIDGFGTDEIDPVEACELVDGYSSNSTDCDDTNAIIYPGADEICDDEDQDCDKAIDEPELNENSGCVAMFKDQDNDGYGDFDEEVCLCQSGGDNFTVNPNDGFTYVTFGGDCNDNYSTLKPLSCDDNYDNDGDGDIDGDDLDCINGYDEYGEELEVKYEYLDGHDNDCDGLVPAIEVDCDDDGSLPVLPLEAYDIDSSTYPDYAAYDDYREAWEDAGFLTALDLGLSVCDEGASFEVVDCLGENSITLECDDFSLESDEEGNYRVEGSGLWMVRYSDSDSGFGQRYDGGYRSYSAIEGGRSTSEPGDCDDNCAIRYPAGLAQESCDGIDNNCSDIDPGIDDDGIPDSLDPDIIIPGTVSPEEMDLDNDGYISCDALTSNRDETQYSDLDCADGFDEGDEDCNTQCSLSSPNGSGGEERCDGFLNVCNGDEEGTDADGDDLQTCGAWGDGTSDLAEDVFMVVWIKDVDWARRGSDPVDLLRPSAPDAPTPPSAGRSSSAFTAPVPPPAAPDTGDTGADTGFGDTGGDTGGAEDTTGSTDSTLADMIPLILPRTAPGTDTVIACDEELEQQLSLLLGAGTLATAMDDSSPSTTLLEACLRDDGACTIVQFSLSEDADEKTYDEIIGVSDVFGDNIACEESTEQWIARSVWQHDRIVEARNTVVELECLRLYGTECSEVDLTDSSLVDDWDTEMESARRHLEADSLWWKELGRFEPSSAHTETLLTCWGDPSDAAGIDEETGGDCADGNASVSRDNAEGPGDLIGLYLGAPADCSTCLDGIDNNCDGNVDCADSACARCFIGQGVGCSRGDDAPCSQAGCSFAAPAGGAFLDRLFSAAFIALFAVLYRRRERR